MITVETDKETKEFVDRETAVQWIVDQFERPENTLVSRGVFKPDGSIPRSDEELPRLWTEFSINTDPMTYDVIRVAKLFDPDDKNRAW